MDKSDNEEEYLSVILNHDVAVVSVPDAQNESSNAVTCT